MREIGGFVAESVARMYTYCYNRTIVQIQGICRTFRVARVSIFDSPDSLKTETPVKD